MIGQRDWYSRIGAIVYAWTVGLLVAIVIIPLVMTYALAGSVLRACDRGKESDIPAWKPVRNVFRWWFSLNDHAISGTGTWSLTPVMWD